MTQTLDTAIEQLIYLRKLLGGDTPFCHQLESTPSGEIVSYEPASFDVCNVVAVTFEPNRPRWVNLLSGTTSKIVAVH